MDLESSAPRRRRRGDELEHALLQAAWDELTERGYAQLTVESVAERAGTSKPVLYRRWSTKADLVFAAIQYVSQRTRRRTVPDTGSLRGDLLVLVREANRERSGLFAVFMAHLAGYYEESGSTPADLRLAVLGGGESRIDRVFDRAVERGEADPARLTPRIVELASTLMRNEMVMTFKPVPDDVLVEIVDTIVLPLVAPR